ncbi:MAG: acetyl-CoA carboxylase, biotin carboxyl carrier protein, partial [Synechococcaceae cyanobacterium ELA182]
MQLDHDQLRSLLALLGESDIQELCLEGDDFRLEVRRNLPATAPVAMVQAPVMASSPPQAAAAASPSVPPPSPPAARSDLQAIVDRHHARMKLVETPPGPPVIASVVAEVYGQPDSRYEDILS